VLELKPEAFLMENVKGLTTRTFSRYLVQQLSRMQDYRIRYAVLNAADYGVPQRRERLFVVGIRKDLGVSFEFPRPTHAEKEHVDLNGSRVRKWITLREAIGDITYLPPGKSEKQKMGTIPFMDSAGRVIELPWSMYQKKHPLLDPDKPSYTLYSHMAKSSRDALLPVSDHIMADYDTLQIVYRRLTVRECLRIQSFPDWWRFPDGCPVSRRYKLVGEAVPPILAYRLAVAIGRTLGLEVRSVTVDEWSVPYFDRFFVCGRE
jgi:DNA (cytosine-5)-methyltransferase 1